MLTQSRVQVRVRAGVRVGGWVRAGVSVRVRVMALSWKIHRHAPFREGQDNRGGQAAVQIRESL